MRLVRLDQVIVEHLRRTGPGGQHRNRRATGIRLTHLPTGIVVMATERRSQAQNRELAFERLEGRLEKRLMRQKARVSTKPTKASVHARQRDKEKRSKTKKLRGSAVPRGEWD